MEYKIIWKAITRTGTKIGYIISYFGEKRYGYYMSTENRARRLEAVRVHADAVIKSSLELKRERPSPLLADKIDIASGKPAADPEDSSVASNFAHQQDFMRVLTGLTALTGDGKYEALARENYKFHFDELLLENGLLRWGGHRYVDLVTLRDMGNKGLVHELKNDFPFYELMYSVDPKKTDTYIKAFWNAHVYEWRELEIGRHGRENDRGIQGIWDREFGDPEPFAPRSGLSFLNTGNDLIYSAAKLFRCDGDTGAVKWGENLYHMYVKSRAPGTGLGVYQFTQPIKKYDTDDCENTFSTYGDRAKRQLGPELGEGCLEGNVLLEGQAGTIYVIGPQVICEYVDAGTYNAGRMLEWARAGLAAFVRYGYVEETNMFRPMLADGRDLTGFELRRGGYYGPAGRVLRRYPASPRHLVSLIPIAARTGDGEIWSAARKIARALGLGDIGERPGEGAAPELGTDCASGSALMAFVRLYGLCGDEVYLRLAERIGDNIANTMFASGFCAMPGQGICDINTNVPLALLELEAALRGVPSDVPTTVYGRR